MNQKDRDFLQLLSTRLKVFFDEMDELAEEIERYVFKNTTQRSPEWSGRANR